MNLKKKTLVNSVGSLTLLGFQYLISILLVRESGYEDAGIFSLAMTVANVFATFSNYGLRNYQVTDAGRQDCQEQYLFMRLTACVLAVLSCVIYLAFNQSFSCAEKYAVLLFLVFSLSMAVNDVMMGSIQIKNRLEINGISNSVRGIACFLSFSLVFFLTHELLFSLAAMAFASVLTLAAYDYRQYKKICQVRFTQPFRVLCKSRALFWEGFPVMLSTVIPMLIVAYPRTSIQKLYGIEQLGYYSTIFTPSVVLSTVLPPLLIALVPEISKNWVERRMKLFLKNTLLEYSIVVAVSGLAFVGAAILGKQFFRLLYGESILPYFPLLYAAIAATGMSCLCVCGNNIIVAIGGKRALAVLSCMALASTLALSLPMIRAYGIYGAAYVLIASYGIQAVCQIVYLVIKTAGRIECTGNWTGWNGAPKE